MSDRIGMMAIVQRTQTAVQAWCAGSEVEARSALRDLGEEALQLARTEPLPIRDPIKQRQRIAGESGRTPKTSR